MTIYELNNLLIRLATNERKITKEILTHIVQIYKMDGYKKLGYSSIIDYLRKGLAYSDDAAYRRWKAVKLLLQIPELGEQIAAGNLNLTQSAQVQKAVEALKKEENRNVSIEEQKELLCLIANKNNFDTQKIIADKLEIKPKLGDQVKPQSDNTVRVEMQLTSEQYAKFLKIKSLLSHQVPEQKNADVLEVLFDLYLNKKLGKQNAEKQKPVNQKPKVAQSFLPTKSKTEKQEGQIAQSFMVNTSLKTHKQEGITSATTPTLTSAVPITQTVTTQTSTIPTNCIPATTIQVTAMPATTTFKNSSGIKSKRSRYIPAKIRRQIFIRAKGKCENVDLKSGVECGSSYKLQIDHCTPLAHGGQTELANLRLLCSTCNAMAARNLALGYETTSYFGINRY